MQTPNEINSSRILNASVEKVYETFSNPELLKQWWGPEGFTNTFHEFDLQPKGKWRLTMHGPEAGHYENSSVFEEVINNQRVAWKRLSQPLFDMEILFEFIHESQSKIVFRMFFKTAEECEKMRPFVAPKNEENFDRLERLLHTIN